MTYHEVPVARPLERLIVALLIGLYTAPHVENTAHQAFHKAPASQDPGKVTIPPRLHPQLPQRPLRCSLDDILREHADLLVDVFNAFGSINHLFPWDVRRKGMVNALHRSQ